MLVNFSYTRKSWRTLSPARLSPQRPTDPREASICQEGGLVERRASLLGWAFHCLYDRKLVDCSLHQMSETALFGVAWARAPPVSAIVGSVVLVVDPIPYLMTEWKVNWR